MKNLLILLSIAITFFSFTSINPNQSSKTKLQITVIDGTGDEVAGATVNIYSSEEDYQNNTNKLIIGETDKKGNFQFKGLGTKSYYVDVRKDTMKNDANSAQTGLLSAGKVNKIIVIIK